jgi:hypothetical protein
MNLNVMSACSRRRESDGAKPSHHLKTSAARDNPVPAVRPLGTLLRHELLIEIDNS